MCFIEMPRATVFSCQLPVAAIAWFSPMGSDLDGPMEKVMD